MNESNSGNNGYQGEEYMPLMHLFNRTGTLAHRYMRSRLHSHMHDPNRGQGRVLSILKLKPEISQKDLAYLLDMRGQSLGELLMKLEKAGYITRTPSGDDRRAMNIRLTEAGIAAAEQTEKSQEESGRFFDCLSGEEQEQLAGILRKIIMAMEKEIDEDYDAVWEEAGRPGSGMHRHGPGMRDEMREHGRAMREHGREMREHGREIRAEMREHGRAFGEEMRDFWDEAWGGPRRPGSFPDEDGFDAREWNDGERGNGPKKE